MSSMREKKANVARRMGWPRFYSERYWVSTGGKGGREWRGVTNEVLLELDGHDDCGNTVVVVVVKKCEDAARGRRREEEGEETKTAAVIVLLIENWAESTRQFQFPSQSTISPSQPLFFLLNV